MLQYDWLVREKIADGALISKWRKPGYEILCSLLAIQKNNHNFGTTSHCRCAGFTTRMRLCCPTKQQVWQQPPGMCSFECNAILGS